MPSNSPERKSTLERPIGPNREYLPVIGLGTWQTFDVGTSVADRAPLKDVLSALFTSGGSVIDSSPMYGRSEQVVGSLVAELGLRQSLFVATKVWTKGREAGLEQIRRSMNFLQVKSLDLIQIHNLLDWRTHLPTLRTLKDGGRVRYIGITHYNQSAHAELAAVMRSEPIDFVQFNYAMDDRAAENLLLPLAAERRIAVLINRPFGEGSLLKKLSGRPLPSDAAALGCESWSQIALKFILANEAVTCAIPATSNPQHMLSNLDAARGPLPDAGMRRRIIREAGLP